MSGNELHAKEAYFREQGLLGISDDEYEICESSRNIEQALENITPPQSVPVRGCGSFLGPTPKELLAKFEAHTTRQRATIRHNPQRLERTITAPELDTSNNFTSKSSSKMSGKTKILTSLPATPIKTQSPFYQRMGDIPRELKHSKNTKFATKIKLLPVHKQLFKEKVIYFYPNNDISMVQRMRIHKMIELGAAWVRSWRDDITHIILDEDCHTYSQLLNHLNMDSLPVISTPVPTDYADT